MHGLFVLDALRFQNAVSSDHMQNWDGDLLLVTSNMPTLTPKILVLGVRCASRHALLIAETYDLGLYVT